MMDLWLIVFLSFVLIAFTISITTSIVKKVTRSNNDQITLNTSVQVIQQPVDTCSPQHVPVNLYPSASSYHTHQPHMAQVIVADNPLEDNPPQYDESFAHTSSTVINLAKS